MINFQGIGQGRNPSKLDSDRLSLHSSRFLKTNPHARFLSLSLSLSVTHTHTLHTQGCWHYQWWSEINSFISSEIHIPRNISCPVSPIGSPLLRPRSPQHMNGRMSPSPISSPRTASGASTPLNGGSGAIPFSNHLVYIQEGLGNLPKSSNGVYVSGPAHHVLNYFNF